MGLSENWLPQTKKGLLIRIFHHSMAILWEEPMDTPHGLCRHAGPCLEHRRGPGKGSYHRRFFLWVVTQFAIWNFYGFLIS